jgi:hypothetical protein
MAVKFADHHRTTLLITEVQRYLAAVDAFRAEGCHPHWLAEAAIGPRLAAPETLARIAFNKG